MTPETIIIALLAIFPSMSGNNRACIETHRDQIIQRLHEASQPIEPGAPVPPTELTAAVAFAETHLGCDAGEGGNWGAPIDMQHRHTAGTHISAVRVLVTGFRVCGSWDASVMRFRTGLCDPRTSPSPRWRAWGRHYLQTIHWLVGRMRQHHQMLASQDESNQGG
jgi:hypothetical protein